MSPVEGAGDAILGSTTFPDPVSPVSGSKPGTYVDVCGVPMAPGGGAGDAILVGARGDRGCLPHARGARRGHRRRRRRQEWLHCSCETIYVYRLSGDLLYILELSCTRARDRKKEILL